MNSIFSTSTRKFFAPILLCHFLNCAQTHGAGLTLITHGLNGNVDDWVTAMGEQITGYYRFPGANFTCYKLYFTDTGSDYMLTWTRLGGRAPAATDSGEVIVLVDWGPLADGFVYSTVDIAPVIVQGLLMTNFISELAGHALAELPVHLVGHSRGGSLVSQISQLLGTNGIWVDHLTTLDPHPLNNDGFFDFIYPVTDAPCRTYENVLFHDNYYQLINWFVYGEPVAGAYCRELTELDGGYEGGLAPSHSDVHLWYHGTIDFRDPASDYAASLTALERQTWWTPYEYSGLFAGFHYSLIGGGNRLSTNQPAGPLDDRIRDGFNQRWNLGAGSSNNRASLPGNNGNWPNLIQFNLAGTNRMAFGETNAVQLTYQWARAASNVLITICLDSDYNPWNGNEQLVQQGWAPGTDTAHLSLGTIHFGLNGATASPGYYSLCAKIQGGGRTRFLYASEVLQVVASSEAPRLEIALLPAAQTRVDVIGVPGQCLVLQSTLDLYNWQSVATNCLSTTNRWTYLDTTAMQKFYRACLQ